MLFLLICDLVNPVLLYCFLVICLLFNKHMNSQDFSRIMTLTILSKFHFESKNSHCLVILLLQVAVHLFVHSRECLKREMEVMLKEEKEKMLKKQTMMISHSLLHHLFQQVVPIVHDKVNV